MSHTQGPWKVKLQQRMAWDRYVPEHWVIKGPDNKHSPIALIRTAGLGAGPSMAVREANARLIAAAPDLLAALEALLDDALELGLADSPLSGSAIEARTAITKARENRAK